MIGPANKQINKPVSAFIRISNFSVTAGASNSDVTAAIASALSAAGEGSTPVPLQPLTGINRVGVIVSNPDNRVEVFHFQKKGKIAADSLGSEVFGRLTEFSGTYRLSYFFLSPVSFTEGIYNFPSTTPIDFEFPYRYSFDRLPSDGIIRVRTRMIDDDSEAQISRLYTELRTPYGVNLISPLTKTPDVTTNVKLIVNTASYHTLGTNPAFTVSGKNVTWNSANAGFDITSTDLVIVEYTSVE